MAADNGRPSTSEEGNYMRHDVSTVMMANILGNEFGEDAKRKLDTDGKRGEGEKRSRLSLADPPQVGPDNDATITEMDLTESDLSGDRLPDEDAERVITTIPFDDNGTYETSPTVGDTLHGIVYQWKHMLLLLHRARAKKYEFRFATEMKLAGKFDDAVLEYQDPVGRTVHRFLQFKHMKVNEMVKFNDLLPTAKKDPFGMVKYFNSWREISINPRFKTSESKQFIICTNLGLDVENLRDIEVTGIEVDDLLKVTQMESDVSLKVTKEPKRTPCFYKFVDKPSILRDTLISKADASDEEISNFFKEFILAVNQLNEIELGTMIKHELGALDQFNLHNVNFIVNSFQNMMVNLLKDRKNDKCSEFLSNKTVDGFFEELQRELNSLITIGLKLSYLAELEFYGIEFGRENSDSREFLDNPDSWPNSTLKLTSSNPTLLTALRVYQTLKQIETYKKKDSLIFIHLEKLLLPDITNQVLCAFESSISHDLIVIDCGLSSNHEHTQKLWSRLSKILEKIPRKKLILIIQENDSSADRGIRHKRDDDISIIDLAKCSREKLLKKNIIKFQGHEERTSFGQIFAIQDFDHIESKKLSALKEIIKPETLIQLIRGEEILIGGEIQGLGEVENYYIRRRIVRHVVIGEAIFKDWKIPDLFAISGIDQKALEKLVATVNRNRPLDACSPKRPLLDKVCILNTDGEAEHFRDICERNPKCNIHWLREESGALVWQQSFGSITNLEAFKNTSIDYDNHRRPEATSLKENQLGQYDEKRRIILLTDTAGMGKSTLLTHLAGKMKRDQSNLLVIKVDLTKHTRELNEEHEKRTFKCDDTNEAVDFLVDKLSNLGTDFERQIFKQLVKVTGETALLFDGYDEICPRYGYIVSDLLRTLAKLSIRRLFVTTRPHTSDALERELGTYSYALCPFDRVTKIMFLRQFWGRRSGSYDLYEMIKKDLKEHANKVLEILVKLINPQMLEFTGIPLQLRLVAEAFPYEERGKLKHFDPSKQPIYITDLYQCFLNKQFDIYLRKKLSCDYTNLVGLKKYRKVMYRSFLTTHQKLALEALFDEKTVTALMKCQWKIDETSSSSQDEEDKDEGEEWSGIVTQVINEKPHFVHRTYAEYLAAVFLSKKLKGNSSDLQVRKFLVANLFVEPGYKVVRAFLDCLLLRSDHVPEKVSWVCDLNENRNARGQTLYHVAAEERNAGIVRFFSIRLRKKREHATLHDITESSDVPLSAVEKSGSIDLEDLISKTTPLMIAVCTRVLALVKCFVDAGADIDGQSEDGLTPLHWALRGRAELDVVRYLVENGADINRASKYHYTPFLSALHCDVQLNIVQYLVEKGAKINYTIKDTTPLLWAIRGDVQLDVLKHLVEKGAEINFRTKTHVTPLHSALYRRAPLDTVKYLVEKGADINCKTELGKTPLYCALSQRAELDVVRYLREKGATV